MRSYEGIDEGRRDEMVAKVSKSLLPRLKALPGFTGYYLMESGDGVMSSIGVFDTSEQADESTRVAATWVREEKLETALPNAPKIMGGEVLVVEKTDVIRA